MIHPPVLSLSPVGSFARRFLFPWSRAVALPCQTPALGVECAWPTGPLAWSAKAPHRDKAEVHASPLSALRAVPSSDIAIEDWDLLFRAVVGRLAATVQAQPPTTAALQRVAASACLSAVLLECVEALGHLQASAGGSATGASTTRQR